MARGDVLLAPAVTRAVVEAFVRSSPARPERSRALEHLTPREREVLELLARGPTPNADIAGALMVSEATVKTHVGHVLTKLGVCDRVHAVIYAYEAGVVSAGRYEHQRSPMRDLRDNRQRPVQRRRSTTNPIVDGASFRWRLASALDEFWQRWAEQHLTSSALPQ